LFLFKDLNFYENAYILQDYGAAGAWPRAAFNVAAALLFWRLAAHWSSRYTDYRLFVILALVTIIITPFVFFAQVAVDRFEYYLIPFQIAVVSRVPEFLSPRLRMTYMTVIYTGYAAALAVWLNYSWIAQLTWLPYRSVILSPNWPI
jgi:hypothetical protein